jgi:NarL family two-component system response regulator YdfI
MVKKEDDSSLRVLVIASSFLRRELLVGMTSRTIAGVHVTSDARISPERFVASKSNVLVADLDGPASAAAMLNFLEEAPAGTGSVALIDDPDPEWVRSALKESVNAVISRDADAEDIQLALQAAEAGFVLIHPTSIRSLFSESPLGYSNDIGAAGLVEDLTAREAEVLRLVSTGLGNKEIAGRLSISEHTVKFHISSILSKMRAGSRTEAVSLGIRRGLIPI